MVCQETWVETRLDILPSGIPRLLSQYLQALDTYEGKESHESRLKDCDLFSRRFGREYSSLMVVYGTEDDRRGHKAITSREKCRQ